MAHKSDEDLIQNEHNTARFFVEQRPVAWVALVAVVILGIYGYIHMPKRKDPQVPVRVAVATCNWPGASAQQVEQLVTRPIEDTIAGNNTVKAPSADDYGMRSITLTGTTYVTVQLAENIKDTRDQFSDINLRLNQLNSSLPQGAGPIQFQSDFGDTAALMLTVASPISDDVEIRLRARSIQQSIQAARAHHISGDPALHPVSVVIPYPLSLSVQSLQQVTQQYLNFAQSQGSVSQATLLKGIGFIGIDGFTSQSEAAIQKDLSLFLASSLQTNEVDPDVWSPIVVFDADRTYVELAAVAGPKYTYADLDQDTDLLQRALGQIPETSRTDRKGVLPQEIYLDYSQQKLASLALQPQNLGKIINAQNITESSGTINAGAGQVVIEASGQYESAKAIGDTIVTETNATVPVYLREVVNVSRGYQSPPQYISNYMWQGAGGKWLRSRAVTIDVYIRDGAQIAAFGQHVDSTIALTKATLPGDLILSRTSDQPLQAQESTGLFEKALIEAVVLVIVVALIGFLDWRSSVLMGLSIPITLCMTLGVIYFLGIDIQQVSIATLIIALGLLVDDPVVASDAVWRELDAGRPPEQASWLGPTKLSRAIVFATATNIIAYLPFLLMSGTTGQFLFSLPVVMSAALVCSRIVSMTFMPMLSRYLLRKKKKPEPTIEEKRKAGFYGFYFRLTGKAIEHRWLVLSGAAVFLVLGLLSATTLKSEFFPQDVQYWSYVDIWLPNDTPLNRTQEAAVRAETVIQQVTADYQNSHKVKIPKGSNGLLDLIVDFVGGGGPRFWSTITPQQQQLNYAQIVIRLTSKDATPDLVPLLQQELSKQITGATIIVNQLQTNPVEFPIELRISVNSDADPLHEAAENDELRRIGVQLQNLLQQSPGVAAVINDWFGPSPIERLVIDPTKANLAGVTNDDIAKSIAAATTGYTVGNYREGDKQISVVARLQSGERAQLSDIKNIYVVSSQTGASIPLATVAREDLAMQSTRILRLNHFRTLSIHGYPSGGTLPSEIVKQITPALTQIQQNLPAGYHIQVGGEQAKQKTGFLNLAVILLISVCGIYLALLVQFRDAVKPILVFAATPFGIVGALITLAITHTPFGFMSFLGIVSLIGVIISHVIVLFDFIEDMYEKGEPLDLALRDAGIVRLRPVLITVAATVLALCPLAIDGGPLWVPLCFAQIGGLLVATVGTLLITPVIYSFFVLDLKWVKWDNVSQEP